jgi:1-acyl-sn-glycerol-3-phosphate acyltransferase
MLSLVLWINRVLLRVFFRMRIAFGERIPSTGPLVVVANHESFLDGLVVGAVLKGRRATFLSAPWLFSLPLVGGFLRRIGALPAHNEGNGVATVREAIRILEKNGTVVVFPQGGISREEVYGGAIFLAIKGRAPLVPVRIAGTKKALPLGRWWPSLFCQITVSVGMPIPAADLCAPGTPTGVAVAQGKRLLAELVACE